VDLSSPGQQLTQVLLTHTMHHGATELEKKLFGGKKVSLDSHISKRHFLFEPAGQACTHQREQAASLQQTLPAKESS